MGGAKFPSTCWQLVVKASGENTQARSALGSLLEIYWTPLYCYLRRWGKSREEAQDLVQGFFEHLLSVNAFCALDSSKGRLRGFLKTALRNYSTNEHARRTASKRGGSARYLDFEEAELLLASDDPTPDECYERVLAHTLMQRGLTRLQGEHERGEREGPFDALRPFFSPNPPPYKQVAQQYGLTEAGLTSLLHRARKRLHEIVKEEVAAP